MPKPEAAAACRGYHGRWGYNFVCAHQKDDSLSKALSGRSQFSACVPSSLLVYSALSTSTDRFCTSLVDAGGRVFSTVTQNLLQLPR